jgi:hypothetical protein
MQQSFNQAADQGRAWDLTDALVPGMGSSSTTTSL